MGGKTHLRSLPVVTVQNTKLADAPVLLFVYFHKAFRAQLVELRRFATDASAAGSFSGELAGELRRKFEFLKLVYKYHSAAEDEVVFLALGERVKNIVSSYSLEHAGTDDLFSSLFHWLHVLEEELGSVSDVLREVILCIGTIQSSICQHMLKEERQVFPLLIEKFSFREQASLVWQFICSVPVMVLKDFLPWMMSYLSHEEKTEVVNCMKDIVPNEDLLQQVISSWLINNIPSTCGASTKIVKCVQYGDVSKNTKNSSRTQEARGCFKWFCRWSEKALFIKNVGHSPIHGLQLYQNAVEKDLRDIQEELCQEKSPRLLLDLDVVMARLNFLADVLVSYCNAFNKFFHPVLEEIASSSTNQFTIDICLGNFKRFLYKSDDAKMWTEGFLLKLQEELDSLVLQVTKQFSVHRTKVFPVISKNCNHEMQRQVLYTSIHVLPLGLLKCVIPWFSAHLSEEESQSILHFLTLKDSFPKKIFPRLLLQWLPFGYSDKTSVGSSWKQLFAMLCFFKRNKSSTFFMLPAAGDMYKTPYSSRMLFSGNLRSRHLHMDDPFTMDRKPIDLLFFFHKAMKVDLDYLVSGSARLASDSSFLMEFQQRFHLIKLFYQIHSNAEDEIAFPAPEAKGKLQKITHSFSIDHELETKHFDKVSLILNEMSELNMLVSTMKYERLCLSLQEICRSMHKILSEHFKQEETELWCLFRGCFTIEEQEKIIGCMLGRISGETLKDMIPWLMDSLTSDEQHDAMSLWLQATRGTMFVDWLNEWYNGHIIKEEAREANNIKYEHLLSMKTIHGQHPSYRDAHSSVFGCEHYKRNSKLLAPCCDQLFTCIQCHDDEADHSVERKHIEKMMCMKCLMIQPIGANCSNASCKSSMGSYFCKICKLFDDERSIYHCLYCNLCRVGEGLGIDYFHCMKCNACLSCSLKEHVCRENWLEVDCPICCEYIFTSRTVIKPLPCGHLMHSACFQEYTRSNYTCPVCSKSLGDMKSYFKMLDELLAEEKMPDEYSNKTQVILCNDCGRKGYRKCTSCGSYNSKLL
ncbi:hypothetical protein Bca52824_083704 [Brassica carinata]|uniref:Uncharacterized protein n=1 Tax=Brassica carinata TaxID=52824 RepID=A0A8X7PMR7_BRACI|nr:hypothetical protein Bca52824_083704 [Brassica carinata]